MRKTVAKQRVTFYGEKRPRRIDQFGAFFEKSGRSGATFRLAGFDIFFGHRDQQLRSELHVAAIREFAVRFVERARHFEAVIELQKNSFNPCVESDQLVGRFNFTKSGWA